MGKKEIAESALQEMQEYLIEHRKRNCAEGEKKRYLEAEQLAEKAWKILSRQLTRDEFQTVESYFMKMNVIAQDEGKYLYLQGIRDGIRLSIELGTE